MFNGQGQAAKSKVLGWQNLSYLITPNANIKSGIAKHLVESYESRLMSLELKQQPYPTWKTLLLPHCL